MSEIILKCINHVISVVNTPDISSGNVNYDTVLFELCPNWTGFTKTAVFYRSEDEVYYQMLDSNNRCTIPKEVLREKGKIRIGLFGVKDNTTITSDVVTYNVSQGAITTGLKPSDPTPDIYAQLIGQYSNLGAEIDVERKRIDEIVSGATADANAELIDIRVGADGTVYDSAGDAVRSQFKMIKEVNALAIVNEASGKEIIATDSSDNEFKNLKVYGETTQRLGKNRIKCDASFMGNIIDGITFKGEYETPIGEGELQYIEVSGKFEPLDMDGGTTASSTSRTIGEATLSAGEYIFSQGYATTSLTPYLVLYLDGVRSGDLSTVGQTEKSIKLTKSTVVRLDIEVRVASGTTITTTKVYPMIRLASETDGTYEPYNGVDPSPESPKTVRGVKGKNQLQNTATSKTTTGITFTVNSDGSVIANGTNTSATDTAFIEINTAVALKKGSYLASIGNSEASGSTFGLVIWNTANSSEVYYVYNSETRINVTEENASYWVRFFVAKSATVSNKTIFPMIRDASIEDGTYSPYNCVRFKSRGKNVFGFEKSAIDVTKQLRALADQRLTFTKIDDNSIKCNYTGGTYGTGFVELNGVDGTKDYAISFVNKENSLGYTPRIEKYASHCTENKLVLSIYSGCGNNEISSDKYFILSDIQVESGTTVTPFEPFNGIETADLSSIELHGLGDAREYIDLERGVIVRKVYKKVFTGNEYFHTYTPGVGGIQFGCEDKNIMQIESENVLCTHLPPKFTWNVREDGIALTNSSGVVVRFRMESLGISTVEDLKAKLKEWYNAGNPMVLYAPIKTQIEEPLSDANLQALRELHSYKPTTVLTNDVGADMTLEYVADTKLYIDKRISEIATAILNN